MPDQPDTPPPERASAPASEPAGSERSEDRAAQEPKHRHRTLVWALVVLASIVLVVSMIANWVQTQVLNSGEFSNSTDKILQNKDVQQQLSIFAVDQLYANVDVQAQIQQKLPSPAPAARRTDHSGDETARHERGGDGARLASSSAISSPPRSMGRSSGSSA